MKKRLFKIFISCLVLCVCMGMAAPDGYAEGETTYVVSFRPGEHGRFSEDAVSYLSGYGDVEMTAAGNIFLVVPSGTAFPAGILSYLGADEGYYYRNGLAGGPVTEDATYVAQFGILSGGGARYTVKFVDSVSGAEVAESYTGYANVGDVIPFTAKTVPGYNVDSTGKSITVSEGAEISFLYTGNGSLDEIRYEYGQDTVVTQTVATAQTPANNNNNNANNAANAANNGDNEAANNGEIANNGDTGNAANTPVEINENEVPLAGNEINKNTPVEIKEGDTPLAGPSVKDGSEAKSSVIVMAVGAVLGVLIILAVVLLLTRKKKKKAAEEDS